MFDGTPPDPVVISRHDVEAFITSYADEDDSLDVVVFAAPQLSLMELEKLSTLLKGRRIHDDVSVLIATNPENKRAAERFGLAQTIEASGAILLEGVCFYQMHARELGEANREKVLAIVRESGKRLSAADIEALWAKQYPDQELKERAIRGHLNKASAGADPVLVRHEDAKPFTWSWDCPQYRAATPE